jgi:predicted metal-dependent phosphoesterase TrpH
VRGFSCDLHIHSTLSPCGSLEMSPKNIVEKADEVGLHIIAITDHNMTENSFYAHELGKKRGITVLSGMELQTLEEIHLLAIFDKYEVAFDFQKTIYDLLPDVHNDIDFYGDQVVVDTKNEIVRSEERLLLNSAQISIDKAVHLIKSMGGIAIPSHIDSATFSIISQLGFVPDNIAFDALEVRHLEKASDLLPLIMQKNVPLISFSDAHYIADIGRRKIILDMDEANCLEIAKALKTLGTEKYGL